ncbi:MAG: DUF4097 family beta strand repeat-containing protein [Jiangellaceae bacterium]
MTTKYPRTFPVAGPLSLSVRLGAGECVVSAADVDQAVVDLQPMTDGDGAALAAIEETRVDLLGNELRIKTPRSSGSGVFRRSPAILVRVTVPTGTSVDAETGSAGIRIDGSVGAIDVQTGSGDLVAGSCGDVRVRTGSGDVEIDEVHAASVKSGSGDITIGRSAGGVELHGASGDVRVGEVGGDVRVSTSSGDVELGTTRGAVSAKTASGDVAFRRAAEGELTVSTASGDVVVGVPEGTATKLECWSASGSVRSQLEPAEAPADSDRRLFVVVRTASGDVTITRAA